MKKATLGFVALTLSGYSAYASPSVDAGTLQQQIEKERESNIRSDNNKTIPDITTPSTKLAVSKGTTITVKNFRFEGNNLLDKETLDETVKFYLNRPISFNELQNVTAAIGETYRANGWVVRSFIPEQNVTHGTVIIKIIEAKFGKIKIESDSEIGINKKKIDAIVSAQQSNNAPISTKNVDRALLLIDDLPGISVSGRLKEGEQYGETDLVLKPTKEDLATGAVIADNSGSRSTGKERLQGFVQLTNPLGLGDLTSLYALGAEGVRFARLEQSFPIGNNGWRVGANASAMGYKLISNDFQGLGAKGSSTNAGLQASYPIIRERQKNLYLNINYDQKHFDNISQGATSSKYDINSGTLALKGNLFDQFGGGGSNNASIAMNIGRLNLGTLDSSEDATIKRSFHKISYNISRNQTLSQKLSFFASLSGQITPNKKLDSSEMFYLGGPHGVRAYPVSEGGGVAGHMINAELRWNFLPNYQLSGFYDYGYVHNSGSTKSYSLDGTGLELSWQSKYNFNVKATWAHRIRNNPNPTSTGHDQDGSSIKNRFWLTVFKQF